MTWLDYIKIFSGLLVFGLIVCDAWTMMKQRATIADQKHKLVQRGLTIASLVHVANEQREQIIELRRQAMHPSSPGYRTTDQLIAELHHCSTCGKLQHPNHFDVYPTHVKL